LGKQTHNVTKAFQKANQIKMDFKQELVSIYNAMRWKENKSVKEAQICRDFRVFVTTKFQDNETRMTLNAIDRGDYDPEKKTLNPSIIQSTAPDSPQLSQPSLTTNPNMSGQSGNAAEVSMNADELLKLSNESAKEAIEFQGEVKKRARKPKV
jgi:hypothetical protein